MLEFKQILEKLIRGEDLGESESKFVMSTVLQGHLSRSEIAAWLTASIIKRETPAEICAYAQAMMETAKKIILDFDVMDTCGTGGDRSNLMNVSTLSALTLASLKIPVAKHGNHAISSKCGSADILRSLGYIIKEDPLQIRNEIKNNYFTFLYAPYFHSAVKHVATVRKELGIQTVFNILGPLCNPARASIQLMGVFSERLLETISQTLIKLKTKCALIFTSEDHLDELSPVAETKYYMIYEGEIIKGNISPPVNIQIDSLERLRVNSPEEALQMAQDTLRGTFTPGVKITALNAAAGAFIWELHQKTVTPENFQTYLEQKTEQLKKHIEDKKLLSVVESWKRN